VIALHQDAVESGKPRCRAQTLSPLAIGLPHTSPKPPSAGSTGHDSSRAVEAVQLLELRHHASSGTR
jgi:hypothetical protein